MLFDLPTRGKPRAWLDVALAAVSVCGLAGVLLFGPPSETRAAPAPVATAVVSAPVKRLKPRDVDCLTTAVYYEARGESVDGQRAVAQVVLNRTRHPDFPKSVCAVVFQGAHTSSHACQFSFTCNGAMRRPRDPEAWRRAKAVANHALHGYVMLAVGPAINFHATNLGRDCDGRLSRIAQVGGHVFLAASVPVVKVAKSVVAES